VAVETAMVMIWACMFVFGIFEYSRLLMDWQIFNNAAREGCRYALANNTSSTLSADVTTIVTNYMAGETKNFTSFTVTVSGMHDGSSTTVTNLAPGDFVTVTVKGNYKFMNVIPMVSMPTSLTLTSTVTMVCEGGT
jgi:Flp pilus assembly protein TadG